MSEIFFARGPILITPNVLTGMLTPGGYDEVFSYLDNHSLPQYVDIQTHGDFDRVPLLSQEQFDRFFYLFRCADRVKRLCLRLLSGGPQITNSTRDVFHSLPNLKKLDLLNGSESVPIDNLVTFLKTQKLQRDRVTVKLNHMDEDTDGKSLCLAHVERWNVTKLLCEILKDPSNLPRHVHIVCVDWHGPSDVRVIEDKLHEKFSEQLSQLQNLTISLIGQPADGICGIFITSHYKQQKLRTGEKAECRACVCSDCKDGNEMEDDEMEDDEMEDDEMEDDEMEDDEMAEDEMAEDDEDEEVERARRLLAEIVTERRGVQVQ